MNGRCGLVVFFAGQTFCIERGGDLVMQAREEYKSNYAIRLIALGLESRSRFSEGRGVVCKKKKIRFREKQIVMDTQELKLRQFDVIAS